MMKDEYFKLLMAFEDKRTFVSVELFSRLKTYALAFYSILKSQDWIGT